jgi:glutaredoxin
MYTIWGRPNCIWCERAKTLLTNEGIPFEYVELTQSSLDLWNFTFPHNPKTVPQIVHGNVLVGGYEDLLKYLKLE